MIIRNNLTISRFAISVIQNVEEHNTYMTANLLKATIRCTCPNKIEKFHLTGERKVTTWDHFLSSTFLYTLVIFGDNFSTRQVLKSE